MKILCKCNRLIVLKFLAIAILYVTDTCEGYRSERSDQNLPSDFNEVIPARYNHQKYRRLSGLSTYSCRSRGKFQDLSSFNSYWSCDSTPDGSLVATRRSCPQGYTFNPELRDCIVKSSKRCGADACEDKNEGKVSYIVVVTEEATYPDTTSECSTTSTCPTTTKQQSKPPCFKCTCEGVFADPASCTSFYICHRKKGTKSQFEKIKVNCPEGMAFDSKAGWCSQTAKGAAEFKKSVDEDTP